MLSPKGRPMLDLIGQRFGKLTAIKPTEERRHNAVVWLFHCDCGNKNAKLEGRSVNRGDYTDCGCVSKRGEHNPLWKGQGEISAKRWHHIITTATKKRNWEFTITIEQAWSLFLGQDRKCALTGEILTFELWPNEYKGTASLDRVDSTKGYTLDNVQWIHKDINLAKRAKTEKEFIEMYRKVVSHADRL